MSLESQLLKPIMSAPGMGLTGVQPTILEANDATIATTGNTDVIVVAPRAGTLLEAIYSSSTTLAANDTNYITFSITNLGQNSKSLAMLAATDANTTKATGGTGTGEYDSRSLTLSTTLSALEVEKDDSLRIRFAVTGTLGAAQNDPVVQLRFAP